ncbi:ABC transporter ATP-binding protein [Aceticella autotrophica]|uniref:ABC transporter ATP-binding protein n=1 Tax=Aceticella autotrophica TaxID=2755338 RepID=A0A975AX33_9THEO|nr:ABC transporter ATP-binding protein [Aceticella autotrophica]QSZ27981.1 ABC transporter ATP-binding protein [Aceticella autotrophica]
MLKIDNIHFSYGDKEILKGIDFTLTDNKIGCFLGPNGSGKSTLLKIAMGILEPKEGLVELNGLNILNQSFKERSKILSYVPQEFSINFPYEVFDVVLMGRNPHVNFIEGPKKEDEKIVLSYLKLLKIEHLKDKPFTHLSGGQKKMVLIARGLAQEGEVMILDEPTASLDFRNQLLVLTVIEKIAKSLNKSVLLSLHDPNLALMFCDEIFLMKDGKIIKKGGKEEIITKENIMQLYNLKIDLINIDNKNKFIFPDKEFLKSLF